MPRIARDVTEPNAQVTRHYWEKGWVILEGVFCADEMDRIADLASAVSMQEAEQKVGYTVDQTPNGNLLPRKINSPFWKGQAFQDLILDLRLRNLIQHFIGGKALLFADQIFMKPPRFGSPKPYHQDNAYFLCTPADQLITAWIALDDVDEENGCLRYIDGSHLGGILPHESLEIEHNLSPPSKLVDLRRESLAIARKGAVIFHHMQTLHTSHENRSDRWRRGYASHWCTEHVKSANDTLETGHFRQAEYPGY